MTKSNSANGSADGAHGDIRDMISFKMARFTTLNDRIAQRLVSRRFGMSLREWRTLATLAYLGQANTAALAREAFLDHAQISRIVGSLVQRGLIERSDGAGRGGVLKLTVAGSEMVAGAMPFVRHQNEQLLAGMTEDDKMRLFRMLDDMIALAGRRYREVKGEIAGLAEQTERGGSAREDETAQARN